ncbi:threonine/serine exporter family protein [Oceanobacillus iheyensis]|uniref:threonine/serine exporter family protein n=1 Tax=Oceanobacillus iheyensis TaxID=182710 RepID=UPI00363E6441
MITQIVMSFIAAAGFGILFNAPRNALIQCGTIGMLGWVLYYSLVQQGMDVVPATTFAAMLVAILSHLCARFFQKPIIVFTVSGIIPLVPGGIAYNAMRHFVENDYNTAIQLSTQVMLLAGGIAIGLMFSEVLNQILKKIVKLQRT